MTRKLDHLIAHWQAQNIISADQATQMRADIALETQARTSNRLIIALSIMGSVALGVGAILIVASNWQDMPRALKLLLSVLLPVFPLCIAHWLLDIRDTYRPIGRGAIVIGLFLIGAAMAMIGQVYHLESEYTRYLSVWALLAAPFVYHFATKESALTLWALTLGALTMFFFETLAESWIDEEILVVLLPLAFAGYGLVSYFIGRRANGTESRWAHIGGMLRVIGVLLILFSLFFTTFQFYANVTSEYLLNLPDAIVRLGLNIAYVGLLIFVLAQAIKRESNKIVSAVFFWFGMFLLVRYFDFFWDMLPTSLFFMGGGALLIGGAIVLERKRKALIASFDQSSIMHRGDHDA